MELNESKVAMITLFISVVGIIFELYNQNWMAVFWAIWSAFLALMFFSVATVMNSD